MLEDLLPVVRLVHQGLHRPQRDACITIKPWGEVEGEGAGLDRRLRDGQISGGLGRLWGGADKYK